MYNIKLGVALIWTIIHISISTILTFLFCIENLIVLSYHFILCPLYLIIALILIFVFEKKSLSHHKNKLRYTLLYWALVILILISLKDFRAVFCIMEYSHNEFTIRSIIPSGCREMFYFLSFLISLLIMHIAIYRYFFSKKRQ